MLTIEEINAAIKELRKDGQSVKKVSDGYHTFGDYTDMRNEYLIALCNAYPEISWKTKKHFDEENDPMFNGDFLAGINTPAGQISQHLKLKFWELLKVPEIERGPKYDGYTEEDVKERLHSLGKENYNQEACLNNNSKAVDNISSRITEDDIKQVDTELAAARRVFNSTDFKNLDEKLTWIRTFFKSYVPLLEKEFLTPEEREECIPLPIEIRIKYYEHFPEQGLNQDLWLEDLEDKASEWGNKIQQYNLSFRQMFRHND